MTTETVLIVQVPRGSAVDRNWAADLPPSIANGRVIVEHLAAELDGSLGPPLAGEVVMSVLSPEALTRDQQEVRDVVRQAGAGDEPLVITVQAAEELREDELAAALDAADHAQRQVIVRVMTGLNELVRPAPGFPASAVSAGDFPAPETGFVVTHFLVVSDQDRSREFYRSVFGAKVVLERDPVIMKIANSWLILNAGGGPTDDKPTVTLAPPADPDRASAFLNIRVADIAAAYADWSARGAEFLTEPKDHGREIRAYIRDPDGHLIEVGQATPG